MAAYAALVSLGRLINRILSEEQDYHLLCDKEQMKFLHEKTFYLQEFLEKKSMRYRSSTIDELEGRIRDVAYRLDRIMESTICRALDQQLPLWIWVVAKTFSIPLVSKALFLRCTVELDVILKEVTEMKMKHVSAALHSTTSSSRGAPIAEVDNVGLNDDIAHILNTITGRASNLKIVPITGMGGIGKTTLARAVYDDSRMIHHFDVRFWVTISQEYDIQDVLRGLLPTQKQKKQPDDRLIEHVYKNLKGRRFLIVLDDMWHKKVWDGVMNAFPDDNKGSRIIITTRELGVASYVGSLNNVHKMQLLNRDQSWRMMREKVYGQEPCPAEFEDIGRIISQNCKGLPLAIVVIAGLLKSNKMKGYWTEVAENTIVAAAATDYDHLFGILSLSYTNLPPQLKACFLYVGDFPEDYVFQTKELVMSWTAEGFLKPNKSKTVEETADECFVELVERSLFLVIEKTYNGKIKSFSIHDVLREVSIRKSKEDKFLLHYGSTSHDQNIKIDRRKVSLYDNDTCYAHDRSVKYDISGGPRWSKSSGTIRKMLEILCNITSLRYLDVVDDGAGSSITFPKSISKLQNLEILIIRNRHGKYCVLPSDIWKLPRLRHFILDMHGSSKFPPLDSGCRVMESLRSLCGARNINFSMDVVERIPNVKKLRLVYQDVSLGYWQEFSLSNLQYLPQLEELSIRCWISPRNSNLPPPSLSGLAFSRNLKKLALDMTGIPSMKEYMSVVGLLPNLEVLKLKWDWNSGNIWEPNEGEFLQLKYLKMRSLEGIKEWKVESFHFPCLEKLVIINCPHLKEVPESIGEIETMQELVLDGSPLAIESVLQIQENQQANCNDSLKIIIRPLDYGKQLTMYLDGVCSGNPNGFVLT